MKFKSLFFLVIASASYADVSINIGQIGELRNSAGSVIDVGSLGILVADQSNNGVLNAFQTTLMTGQFVGAGSDDRILGVYSAVNVGSGAVGFDFSSTTWTYSGSFGQNDNLYFLWFPTISVGGSQVSAGTQYGQFRSDTKDDGGDIAWVAPADGSSNSIYSLTAALGGSPAVSNVEFTATLTAVPEPSSYAALLGACSLGFGLLRRRKRA
jgi:hypothetical protein